MWQQTRSEHRTAINKNKRAGFVTNFVDFSKNIDLFKEVYEQTMQRVGASNQYFFSEEYFGRFFGRDGRYVAFMSRRDGRRNRFRRSVFQSAVILFSITSAEPEASSWTGTTKLMSSCRSALGQGARK